jgi:hypothetical protein
VLAHGRLDVEPAGAAPRTRGSGCGAASLLHGNLHGDAGRAGPVDGAAGAPRRRRSVGGCALAYRAPVAWVRYRSRSRAISAMWWMNSRLDAQTTLMNGNSAASLQGYWQ